MSDFVKSFFIFVGAFLIGAGALYLAQQQGYLGGSASITEERCALRKSLRKLWTDHVVWTHSYITAVIGKLEDQKYALERLLQNQKDFGQAIVPFYGPEAGDQFAKLMTEHIVLAGEVVAAAQNSEQAKLKEADEKWHKNASDIAAFLHNANPKNWSQEDLISMLNEHLALLTKDVLARLHKKWAEDVETFDKILNQALMMADDLSDGIYKQFPNKF